MQWRVRVSLSPYQRQTRQFANPFDQNCSVYQAVLQSKRKKYQHVTQSSPSENQMTKQIHYYSFHFIKEQIIKYSRYSITEFQKSSGITLPNSDMNDIWCIRYIKIRLLTLKHHTILT